MSPAALMQLGFSALARNRMRAALTVLGIVIGVAAVIATLAIGQGARAAVQAQIRTMGANTISVIPGTVTSGGARGGMGGITRVEVSVDDGVTWHEAHLEEPRERWLWVRWSCLWDAKAAGAYRIRARATDETGRVQPQIPWNYQRKHFDGIVPTDVTVV